ncbi:accessory factor UbiK family protein [Azospirillum rugosum]|uniref:BMFP domain-containing protein YqiC n=1 Tax=Azospirillum rugosum TaxID=416170 RepID=A0ABS4SHX9_9PROT|nr:accessory factor UbiK family protein [Azospirillum rugosum]MBP2292173.1 BMFP domain-containing protein YqiC [Azospirillum rugosum]MDQ0525691.1 BMFP domain-containing protein YqiC [Azospirillum rugosum]
MQVDNKLLDDLARVAGGALGALSSLREEAEAQMRQQFERVLSRMDVVSREEYEAVRAMAAKAREEQEALTERITALEATVATLLADRALRHEEGAPHRRAPGQASGVAGKPTGTSPGSSDDSGTGAGV